MTSADRAVFVITPSIMPARMQRVLALAAGDQPSRTILQIGRGSRPAGLTGGVHQLGAMHNRPWAGQAALRRALNTATGGAAAHAIVHLGDPHALAWLIPVADAVRGVLVEYDVDLDPTVASRWYAVRPPGGLVAFVCASTAARRALLESGVPANRTVVIRPMVDFAALRKQDRPAIRRRLGCSDSDWLVAIPPPTNRASGAFEGAWATLLLQQIHASTRMVVGGSNQETRRIHRLMHAARHAAVLCADTSGLGWNALLAAADAVIHVPTGPTPLDGLGAAMAAGLPIVASARADVCELLTHGVQARLCHPKSPKEAARRLLEIREDSADAKRMGDSARDRAFELFSGRRMVEQYQRVYENLKVGRELDEGVVDSALTT